MRLGILVNEGPFTHQASDTAYRFAEAALARGHEIWRVFFYDKNSDDDLTHIHGLADLKEVWLLGSKVTNGGAADLRERLPDVKVFY